MRHCARAGPDTGVLSRRGRDPGVTDAVLPPGTGAAVGMALYVEPLDPSVFAGGALILGANYINLRSSQPAPVAGK